MVAENVNSSARLPGFKAASTTASLCGLETYFTPLCLCFCVCQMVAIIPTLQCFCENERMHTCLWRTVLSQFHSFSEEGISLNAPDWDFGGDRAVKPRSSLSPFIPGAAAHRTPSFHSVLFTFIRKILQSTSWWLDAKHVSAIEYVEGRRCHIVW